MDILVSIEAGKMAKSNKRIHQMTIAQRESAFPDDDACKAYFVAEFQFR